jgi:pimeloyl-ACP methyl ester carboxylesterase
MVTDMLLGTPLTVIASLLPCFATHDKLGALGALRRVNTLVLVGDRDAVTPPSHSRRIVAAVPGADLVVVPNAGHLLVLERPLLVNECIQALAASAGSESAEAV